MFMLLGRCNKIDIYADLIIIAPSYTMDTSLPWSDAIAIKKNRVLFVGSKEDVLSYKNKLTRVVRHSKGMALPGFIDTHVHLLWGGIEMEECQLSGLTNSEQILDVLENYNKQYPNKKWIRGNGWSLPVFINGNPRKELLDKIIPDKPVYLLSADGHSAWVNSKALELSGITNNTLDPLNGRIERDIENGEPSGVLREDAMSLVESLIPHYSKSQIDNGLKLAVKEANSFGITSILDAGTENYNQGDSKKTIYDGYTAYKNATQNKNITLRVNATQYVYPQSWRKDLEKIKSMRYVNELGSMNTVKIFSDGVIEGGTASLLEPYIGTDNYGILNWDPDTLKEVVALYESEGFQIHFHAIGDRGIRTTLDAFEYSKELNGPTDIRHMMSHTQLVHPDDIPRFKELDVIATFQPLWAYPDLYMKELTLPVLGPIRSKWNYPINSIVSNGGRITGGSDWSVTSLNPLYAIEVAVTRREPGNTMGEVLYEEEAVSLETILEAYTLDGAYSLFKEKELGSIEKGKLADIIILDRNLFTNPIYEIHKAKVVMTIFNGEIVYENKY